MSHTAYRIIIVACLLGSCTRSDVGASEVQARPEAIAEPQAAGVQPPEQKVEEQKVEEQKAEEQKAEEQKVEEQPPGSPSPVRFWVAERGLMAHDLEGKRVARLGKSVIDDARKLKDGRIVALAEKGNELTLLVLDAEGKTRRRVRVPNVLHRQTCAIGDAAHEAIAGSDQPDQPDPPEELDPLDQPDPLEWLSIQSANDFTASPTTACLTLQDRNDNMVSYRMLVAIELATGAIEATVTEDYAGDCEAAPSFSKGGTTSPCDRGWSDPWIEPVAALAPPARAWSFDFAEESAWVSEGGERRYRLCQADAEPDEAWSSLCASLEELSPSGRWILLSGRSSEGDYIHRDVLLLDRSSGTLLQVRHDHRQAPAFIEVTPEQVFSEADDRPNLLDLVGESDYGWLPEDRLWVDGKLLIPERREIVQIGGRRARVMQ